MMKIEAFCAWVVVIEVQAVALASVVREVLPKVTPDPLDPRLSRIPLQAVLPPLRTILT
jgi:hypothetical protein